MQFRSTIIVLVILFCVIVTSVTVAGPEKTNFTPIQISDHAQTEGDIQTRGRSLKTSSEKSHLVWIEETGSLEGTDLFYRDLTSNGATMNISDITQTEGDVNDTYIEYEIASDGSLHALWFEATGQNYERDLFYWNVVSGTIKLTNRSQFSGALWVSDIQMVLDSNSKAHILWRDFSESEGNNFLYYWHDGNTTQLATETNTSTLVLGTYQGHGHVLWQKGATLYHWNSETAVTDTIPTPVSEDILVAWMSVDNTGKAHVIWNEDASDACFYYWDSVSKSNTPVLSGSFCNLNVASDGLGMPHVNAVSYSAPNYITSYWNPTLIDPVQHTIEDGSPTLRVADNGKVHIYYKTSNKLWYWNDGLAAFVDLSNLAGVTYDGIEILQTHVDSQGRFYLIWWQDGLFYWNSETAVVSDISNDFFGSTIPYPTDIAKSESNVIYFVAANNGEIKCWNSQTEQSQLVSDLQGYTEGLQIIIDRLENEHIAWDQSLPGSDHGLFYWNEEDGSVELDETAVNETRPYGVSMYLANNDLHLLWTEEADTPSEGNDVFVATIEQNFNQLFLPMVIR